MTFVNEQLSKTKKKLPKITFQSIHPERAEYLATILELASKKFGKIVSLVEPDMVGVVSDFLKKNGNDVDPRIERIHELTKSPKYEDWSDEYQAGFYESLCRRWKHVLDCQFLNWEDARNMWELFSIKYR